MAVDSNLEKAKEWYDFLKGIKANKNKNLKYSQRVAKSILYNKNVDKCYEDLKVISKKNKMKGFSEIQYKILEICTSKTTIKK